MVGCVRDSSEGRCLCSGAEYRGDADEQPVVLWD